MVYISIKKILNGCLNCIGGKVSQMDEVATSNFLDNFCSTLTSFEFVKCASVKHILQIYDPTLTDVTNAEGKQNLYTPFYSQSIVS